MTDITTATVIARSGLRGYHYCHYCGGDYWPSQSVDVELYEADTLQPVCYDCARQHAPQDLFDAVEWLDREVRFAIDAHEYFLQNDRNVNDILWPDNKTHDQPIPVDRINRAAEYIARYRGTAADMRTTTP
jgi:hypothetical protein